MMTRGIKVSTSISRYRTRSGNQRHPEQLAGPVRIGAHHAVARERGVNVSIRDHDESRLQRRQNLVLETIGEIRGVEQRERRDG